MRCVVFKLRRKSCVCVYLCLSEDWGFILNSALKKGWVTSSSNPKNVNRPFPNMCVRSFNVFIMTRLKKCNVRVGDQWVSCSQFT